MTKKISLHVLLVCSLILSCGRFGDKVGSEKHEDNKLRIVSISKQLTEIIFAVGGVAMLATKTEIVQQFYDAFKISNK